MSATLAEKAHGIYWDGDPRSGWALIVPGHGLPQADLDALAHAELEIEYQATEIWARFHRRIKWCERIDGFGCDDNGEWHAHWSSVQANPAAPDARWTLLTRADS